MNPHDKRLAIAVPDHPLEYGGFEGIIPAGAEHGQVVIWDAGKFIPLNDPAGRFGRRPAGNFRLEGRRLHGEFALVRFMQAQRMVLLAKKRDGDADASWKIERALTPSRRKVLK